MYNIIQVNEITNQETILEEVATLEEANTRCASMTEVVTAKGAIYYMARRTNQTATEMVV